MRCFAFGVVLGCLTVGCAPSTTSGGGDGDGGAGGDGGPRVDGGPNPLCRVVEDDNGVPDCTDEAPPASFEPAIQWSWPGVNGDIYAYALPLVANLTDDNGDGSIDLCDTPDVIVVASAQAGIPFAPGRVYVLDGQTGALLDTFDQPVENSVSPAIGDIDGDGLVELVTVDTGGAFIAFEHDGTMKWRSTTAIWSYPFGGAIALADLDEDGDVEIVGGAMVVDHNGVLLWTAPDDTGLSPATAIANLDGQPGLEVVLGRSAYHANGQQYYRTMSVEPGFPQIANLDADPEPEVLVTNQQGFTVLEHDGTVKYQDARPTGVGPGNNAWIRPAVIHDVDGNGTPEMAMSSASFYTVFRPDQSIVWSSPVSDQTGVAGGTAFDFLGDGSADAMYGDEHTLFVFGDQGQVLLESPRSSGTLIEYPVVADLDNDGSAEIVVISSAYPDAPLSPTVQVIRDVEDRWVQARRIWNQHTYHVTNVREDGTIPQHEVPSWTRLNTFRSNAQIGEGGVCDPID